MSAFRGDAPASPGALLLDVRRTRRHLVAGIAFIVLGIALTAVTISVVRNVVFLVLDVALFAGVFAGTGVWALVRSGPMAFRIHEHALVIEGREPISWASITEVRTRRTAGGAHGTIPVRDVHTFRRTDGSVVELVSHAADNNAVLELLHEATLRGLLGDARRVLDTGGRVTLGPVAIDNRVIWSGDRSTERSRLETASIDGEHFLVRDQSLRDVVRERLETIPNPHVLLALLGLPTRLEVEDE